MTTPPEVIHDGKTGEAILIDQAVPWDPITFFICAMVSTLGYETTRRYLFGDAP